MLLSSRTPFFAAFSVNCRYESAAAIKQSFSLELKAAFCLQDDFLPCQSVLTEHEQQQGS